MKDDTTTIRWYQTEQEIKSDTGLQLTVTSDDIESVRKASGDKIPVNVLALVDRRVGKKRLSAMEEEMQMKHPVVRYFYDLRRRA